MIGQELGVDGGGRRAPASSSASDSAGLLRAVGAARAAHGREVVDVREDEVGVVWRGERAGRREGVARRPARPSTRDDCASGT